MTIDTAVFNDELKACLPKARSFAGTLASSASDRDDLVQDAIVRALENGEKYKSGTNMQAWLNRIIKNLFLDREKSHAKSRTDTGGIDVERYGAISNQELQIEVSEVQQYLSKNFSTIDRSVVMQWAEGFRYEEIAENLELSRGNVAVRLCRVRKQLRDQFATSS